MAEGFARALRGDRIEPASAGVIAKGLNPRAVQAMFEVGVDISTQTSDEVGKYADTPFDYVVTVCGHAHETCPVFPARAKVVHVGFDDPPQLAEGEPDPEKAMSHYRRVRDEIRAFVESLPESLERSPATPK
jgi:arsenate reductase